MSNSRPFAYFARKYLIWSGLNVLLPLGAAFLTYWLASTYHRHLSVDALMLKVFSSADNFIVAAVLFGVTFFELDENESGGNKNFEIIARAIIFVFLLIIITLFVAYKLNSLNDSPNLEILAEGASRSLIALVVACLWALSFKFVLLNAEMKRSGVM